MFRKTYLNEDASEHFYKVTLKVKKLFSEWVDSIKPQKLFLRRSLPTQSFKYIELFSVKGIANSACTLFRETRSGIDAEYYMSLNAFYQYIKSIPFKTIQSIVQKTEPSFNRPFNVTSIRFSYPASQKIWDEVNKYV
ncbi:hypothetical protein ACFCYN_25220 [Gottfriedia sp. NPDC056225]|uniref:hypothetical protein n=1 Tax=Gottfriedia sp. NPDC056225 TaxID=3345751 RepID=UPI0035D74D56